MTEGRTYTPDFIDLLERDLARLRAEQVAHAAGDRHRASYAFNFRRSAVTRAMLILDFLRLGCTVVEHPRSLVINARYEVAVDKKRWRRCSESQWHWYKTLRELIRTAEPSVPDA